MQIAASVHHGSSNSAAKAERDEGDQPQGRDSLARAQRSPAQRRHVWRVINTAITLSHSGHDPLGLRKISRTGVSVSTGGGGVLKRREGQSCPRPERGNAGQEPGRLVRLIRQQSIRALKRASLSAQLIAKASAANQPKRGQSCSDHRNRISAGATPKESESASEFELRTERGLGIEQPARCARRSHQVTPAQQPPRGWQTTIPPIDRENGGGGFLSRSTLRTAPPRP